MKRCGSCVKIIWPWQKKYKIKWVVDSINKPEGVVRFYHNPKLKVDTEKLIDYDKFFDDVEEI